MSIKTGGRKPVSEKLQAVISKLEASNVNDNKDVKAAVSALQKVASSYDTPVRKPRAPSEYNKFVTKQMKAMKDLGVTTQEKFKQIASLWKSKK